jgi:sigma-B regulation protein RsbU (phosphoserine phosphatase)
MGQIDSLEEVGGPPLGLFADVVYAQATLTLRPGDVLVLYTDGVTEAMNSRSKPLGWASKWPRRSRGGRTGFTST